MNENTKISQEPKKQSSIRRITAASFVGSMVEWYDFFLYGTAAALVFSPLFFPDVSPFVGLFASFATYGVGFLARPLGAVVGGHFGDKHGRKTVLVVSLVGMGIATMLVGALPVHAQIGDLAPVSLVVLRLIQGTAAGMEWGGAALMTVESAPSNRRGLYGSFTQASISAGMLIAVGAFSLTRTGMSEEAFMSWGWRIPFLASGILIIIGYVIRRSLSESATFIEAKKQNDQLADNPIRDLVVNERRAIWLTIGMRLCQNSVYYLLTTFAIAYLATSADASENVGTNAVAVGAACSLITLPLWAIFSDRVGRRPIYIYGSIAAAIFIGPFFLLLDTGRPIIVILAVTAGLCLFHDAMYGPQAAFFAELFSTGVRFSGASIGYQFGAAISGGVSPLIAVALLGASGGRPWLIVVYVVVLSVITAFCAWAAPETHKQKLAH